VLGGIPTNPDFMECAAVVSLTIRENPDKATALEQANLGATHAEAGAPMAEGWAFQDLSASACATIMVSRTALDSRCPIPDAVNRFAPPGFLFVTNRRSV
jgi:hypothetical protein